jgi:uncharacterized protein (TIGR03437 family)
VGGGVNADQFISRNETVTATVNVSAPTSIQATNVNVQLSVNAASEVPAGVVSINGGAAGQAATTAYGDIAGFGVVSRSFQITLLDDGVNRPGKKILFDVTITPASGVAFSTQFTITAQRKLLVYRTRFEPTDDLGGPGVVVIPESAWGLRPNSPNAAPSGDGFAGVWRLTTEKAGAAGSTASLGDPSGLGSSYGVSVTTRPSSSTGGAGIYDQTRWWTLGKILLPGLTRNPSTDKVANPSLAAQLNAAIESFDVDINADFTGDTAQNGVRDLLYLRLRPYINTAVSATDDTGFDDESFVNFLLLDSGASQNTNGFQHFSLKPGDFLNGGGVFGVDAANPDNSDVAFRLELQFQRNGAPQQGEGVFIDNLELRLSVDDLASYASVAQSKSVSVSAASYAAAVAPGAILSAFGGGITTTSNIGAVAGALPLPTELSGVAVRVNGVAAPLFFAGVTQATGGFQINYQLPYETPPGVAFVEVFYGGVRVTSEFLTVAAVAPSVFTLDASGKGQAAAQNQDFTLNGDTGVNPSARPVARGSALILYANGQGANFIDPSNGQSLDPPVSGAPPPAGKLFVTRETPTVTIGGVPASVEFSGLTPGLVGLWQINLRVPQNAPTGNAVPIVVSQGGKTSATITVAVN